MQLNWDVVSERIYETGVSKGVLYPRNAAGNYPLGVAWNGLIGVTESPSGAEPTPFYADNIKYANMMSNEEFGATIEAYTYPSAFAACDGSAELTPGMAIGQQGRQTFGLAYRTILGNDTLNDSYGYKLHLVYGCLAAPSEKAYQTQNESPEAITFSWELSTTPESVTGKKPTSIITINSTKVDPTKLAALELILYGNVGVDPRLPKPDEVLSLLSSTAPSALALSTSVPADAATGVVVSANIVLTFNNKIQEESIVLTTQAGAVVPFSKSWDVTGKILTIDPTANLTAATSYNIVVAGVSDIYSQILTPVVRKFTTA